MVAVVAITAIGQGRNVHPAMNAREGSVLLGARQGSAFRVEGIRLRMRRVPFFFPCAGTGLARSVTRFTAVVGDYFRLLLHPDVGIRTSTRFVLVLATVTRFRHVPPVGVGLGAPAAASSPLDGARGSDCSSAPPWCRGQQR